MRCPIEERQVAVYRERYGTHPQFLFTDLQDSIYFRLRLGFTAESNKQLCIKAHEVLFLKWDRDDVLPYTKFNPSLNVCDEPNADHAMVLTLYATPQSFCVHTREFGTMPPKLRGTHYKHMRLHPQHTTLCTHVGTPVHLIY